MVQFKIVKLFRISLLSPKFFSLKNAEENLYRRKAKLQETPDTVLMPTFLNYYVVGLLKSAALIACLDLIQIPQFGIMLGCRLVLSAFHLNFAFMACSY